MATFKFYYLNTLRQSDDVRLKKANNVLQIWNEYIINIPQVFTATKKFSLASTQHPFQLDTSSCGVLVCKMGQHIATGQLLSLLKADKRSISRYRRDIWQTILENRDYERCTSCRQVKDNGNATENDRWIECSGCSLWYHLTCAKIDYSISTDEMHRMLWECPYCLH